jgi:hypothetical protein
VKKAVSGGEFGIIAMAATGRAQRHGGAEFNAKECRALTVINKNQP